MPVERRDEANERERERERRGGGRRGAGAEKGAEKTHFHTEETMLVVVVVVESFFFFFKINFCKMAKLSPNKTFATKNYQYIYHGFG